MAKKLLTVRFEPEQLEAIRELAKATGRGESELIRECLPSRAVVDLFIQARQYDNALEWGQIAITGPRRSAIAAFTDGAELHLKRLGMSSASNPGEIDEAVRNCLTELEAESEFPVCQKQLARARKDRIFLGCLFDSFKRAKAGQPGFRLQENKGSGRTTFAVLAGGKILNENVDPATMFKGLP